MSGPNASIAALIAGQGQDTSSLKTLRDRVSEARDLEMEFADLELRLAEVRQRLTALYTKELPELLDSAQVNSITLEAEGNMPRIVAEVKPFYSACIAASWEEERKRIALDYLQEEGFGDLIKTEVNLSFNREERTKALAVKEALEKRGLTPNVKESVHSSTLTAFVKEQIEKHHRIPDLEKIGATVGRVVKLKGIKS